MQSAQGGQSPRSPAPAALDCRERMRLMSAHVAPPAPPLTMVSARPDCAVPAVWPQSSDRWSRSFCRQGGKLGMKNAMREYGLVENDFQALPRTYTSSFGNSTEMYDRCAPLAPIFQAKGHSSPPHPAPPRPALPRACRPTAARQHLLPGANKLPAQTEAPRPANSGRLRHEPSALCRTR